MCGRYSLTASPEDVRALFEYTEQPNFPQRYNIAPTQAIAIVTGDGGGRHFSLVRWGLLPSWVKDPQSFTLLINARMETAAGKPSFRAAMRRRRCLIPASGFYEWQKTGAKQKVPHWLSPEQDGIVAFAGIFEEWSDPQGGEVMTGAILTRQASPDITHIHHRMPVVVEKAQFSTWLANEEVKPDAAVAALGPARPGYFSAVPVSTRVNAVRNDTPDLQEPVDTPEQPAASAKQPKPDKDEPEDGQMSLL